MNYLYVSSIFGLITIAACLLKSGAHIAEFANDNIYESNHNWAVMKAKKLDVNNDGLISLDELTTRPNRNFQKPGHKKDSQIDESDFNARLVAMFNRMDSNSDGTLDDIEISTLKHRHHGKSQDNRGAT